MGLDYSYLLYFNRDQLKEVLFSNRYINCIYVTCTGEYTLLDEQRVLYLGIPLDQYNNENCSELDLKTGELINAISSVVLELTVDQISEKLGYKIKVKGEK